MRFEKRSLINVAIDNLIIKVIKTGSTNYNEYNNIEPGKEFSVACERRRVREGEKYGF